MFASQWDKCFRLLEGHVKNECLVSASEASYMNVIKMSHVSLRFLNQSLKTHWTHLYLLLAEAGAQVGLVAAAADVAELFYSLGWHRLREAEATPGVCGGPDLGDHRFPLHGWQNTQRQRQKANANLNLT